MGSPWDFLFACRLGDRFPPCLLYLIVMHRHRQIVRLCQPLLNEPRALECEGAGLSVWEIW